MARWTGLDYLTLLRASCGGPSAVGEITDAQIMQYLEQEYVALAGTFRHPELDAIATVTTADGTAEYTLSAVTDILVIYSAKDLTHGQKVREITRSQYESLYGTAATEGTPVYLMRSGVSGTSLQLTFFPTPAGTYSIRIWYAKRPTALLHTPAASVTSSILNEQFDETLFSRAEVRCLRHLKVLDAAAQTKTLGEIRGREYEIWRTVAPKNYPRGRVRNAMGEIRAST